MAGVEHPVGVFSNLWGTMKQRFHIGGPDNPCFEADMSATQIVKVKEADESTWTIIEAEMLSTHNNPSYNALAGYLDTSAKIVNIIDDFNGATPPSSLRKGFYLCSVTGGSYTENDVVYHNGLSSNTIVFKSAGSIAEDDGEYVSNKGRTLTHITTIDQIILTNQTLIADAVYAWEYKGGGFRWVLKGFAGAGDDNKLIRFRVQETGGTSSSVAPVPAGHFVTRVLINVVAAFSAACTLTIKIGANPIMADNASYIHLIGNYELTDPYVENTGDEVTAELGGTVGITGDAYVIVEFGKIYT